MKVKTKPYVHDHVVDEYDHQHLEPNKIYNVIGIDDEDYRIINEIGEPILYPKALFDVIESSIPDSWVRQDYEDGEYYIDPPELSRPGFYEDFFDGNPEAIAKFQAFVMLLRSKTETEE